MSFTITSLALLAIAFAPCAFPQAGLVGQKSPDGKIRFQAVEEFQIEGSHRVRLMPIATQRITPDDARHFPRLELAQAGAIRTDANHRLVRLDDAGKPSDVILPDDFAPKTPVDAATAQGRLAIQTFESKKAKTGELIAPEQFFVFVPGADPDRLALALINRSSVFLNLDEQLAAMEGFVASFPDSPSKSEFRSELQDRVAAGIAAFENHGAYADLLLTRRYAELAQRAFPGDPALGQSEAVVANRIQTVDSTRLTLRSLAASAEWDLLLDAYLPFERYQWSFPDMMDLRHTALEESAHLHAHRGALLAERHMYPDALRELTLATRRDPDNRETAKLLETTREAASRADAATAKPRVLPAGSPQEQRFKFSLHDAERALQDKDFAKVDTYLQEALADNKDAPEILILQARLLAARGRDAEALPLLDAYDRTAADPAARELGKAARNGILSSLEKKRTDFRQQLLALQHDGDYSKLRAVAGKALALDPDDDDFLYYGGTVAALFRDRPAARERLDRYLVRSNSLRGDLEARDRAYRARALLDAPPPGQLTGTPNWFSGRPLADGIYYCPVSGAFQLPIDTIAGYKLKMSFQWDRNRLNAITTAFDDEKGSQNYHALGGPGDSQGNFYFAYVGSDPQVQVVSTGKFDAPATPPDLRVSHAAPNPPHLVDEHGLPRILLQDSAQFNPAILAILEGPLSTTVAGNAFFNPFIWDGLHYFSPTYDGQGRMSSAREWNADNLLRFTWSGDRLTEIRAFRKDSPNPYYQRTISYSGTMILGETYAEGSRTGQIKYVYSGKVLQQVKVEDGGVHDGKTWTVRMR
jgi:tetratricopeptide (TPR) repeat protein